MTLLACPQERAVLKIETDLACCPVCETIYRREKNIWRFLTPAQFEQHKNFLERYRIVRHAEGWGSRDAMYYRNLPNVSRADPQRDIWRVRAASFNSLLRLIGQGARVLEIGAGNGWLANQLTQRGHQVAALDLNDDEFDGLGAVKNYSVTFECYQADFDTLPFAAAQFDFVIFNSSLHYSSDFLRTVKEGLRVLTARGRLVVMDSPLYHAAESGRTMLGEKAKDFRVRFGFDEQSEALGFLAFADFENRAREFGLQWHWIESFVAVRWALRHRIARWRGQREPAHFGLMVGQVKRGA